MGETVLPTNFFLYHANIKINLASGMKSTETNIVISNKMATIADGNT
jgi:hypothetical protein